MSKHYGVNDYLNVDNCICMLYIKSETLCSYDIIRLKGDRYVLIEDKLQRKMSCRIFSIFLISNNLLHQGSIFM